MNFEVSEAVQSAVNPGEIKDLYYYGDTNVAKQAYPVIKNNKFKLQFANLGAGTSQFSISPNQGVSDFVVRVKLPAVGNGVSYTNASVSNGWGYQLIRTISIRYAGSDQFFFTGPQMYAQNLLDAENDAKRDAIVNLAGTFAVGSACAGAEALLYINLPHNSPRAEGKPLPFPSDTLTQPIILSIELNPISSIFGGSNSVAPSALPSALATAELQVTQEMMSDSADLIARRIDMNTNALSVPLKYFAQQEVLNTFNAGASAQQQLILSGFRAGEIRDLMFWLEVVGDASGNGVSSGSKQWVWPEILDAEIRYNGEIFFTAPGQSARLFNLIEDTKTAGFNTSVIDYTANPATASDYFSSWTLVKFSQVDVPYDRMYCLLSGKPILNAVLNMSLTLPDEVLTLTAGQPSVVTAGTKVVLHAVYLYNATILCSRGTSQYIF